MNVEARRQELRKEITEDHPRGTMPPYYTDEEYEQWVDGNVHARISQELRAEELEVRRRVEQSVGTSVREVPDPELAWIADQILRETDLAAHRAVAAHRTRVAHTGRVVPRPKPAPKPEPSPLDVLKAKAGVRDPEPKASPSLESLRKQARV